MAEIGLTGSIEQTIQVQSNTQTNTHQSPIKSLIILAALIFLSEAVIMFVLSFLPEFTIWIEALLDSSALLICLAPSLYIFVFRPMVAQLSRSQGTESIQRELNKSLESAAERQKNQLWLQTGQMELNNKMRGEQDVAKLSKNVISYLATYLEAQVGVIYLVGENGTLELSGSYAYMNSDDDKQTIKFGEGLAGQAALTEQYILTSKIPENYIKINSGWGDSAPRYILVVPFLYEGTVKGVIELGSFNNFTDTQIKFVNLVTEQIAIAVNVVQVSSRTKDLLEKTQAQSEELQVQQEELQAANEELQGRAEELKVSEEQLQEQQAELEATNEELEEQIEEKVDKD